jgi:hypothetical protein
VAFLGLSPPYWVVLGHAAAAVLLGTAFFRRYRVARPPVGVFDRGDVALLLGAVVLAPLLYLALPRWAAAGLLGLGVLGALLVVLEPVLGAGRGARDRWGARLVWPLALALLAADAVAALHPGVPAPAALVVNNAVLVLAVVGVTNLWAQSGLKAREAAVLAGALAVYDAVATAWLPLTDALLGRLAGLPFAPLVAWPGDPGGGLGIGLGDLLLATVVPLVLRKAYGPRAGAAAVALAVAPLAGLLALLDLGLVRATIPAMVVLGPLTVAQYLVWRRRGVERTTREYLRAEPTAPALLLAPTREGS